MADARMPRTWPAFVTRDLGDSPADMAEMDRRWAVYAQEMAAVIAQGGVHLDGDGWWVDDATGELIGPDPAMERPLDEQELAGARPFAAALPALADAIRRGRGPQKAATKVSTTIRLSRDMLDYFKSGGRGWQSRIDDALRDWVAANRR